MKFGARVLLVQGILATKNTSKQKSSYISKEIRKKPKKTTFKKN